MIFEFFFFKNVPLCTRTVTSVVIIVVCAVRSAAFIILCLSSKHHQMIDWHNTLDTSANPHKLNVNHCKISWTNMLQILPFPYRRWFYYVICWRQIHFAVRIDYRNTTQQLPSHYSTAYIAKSKYQCWTDAFVAVVLLHIYRYNLRLHVFCPKIENATFQMHTQCKMVHTSIAIHSLLRWNGKIHVYLNRC